MNTTYAQKSSTVPKAADSKAASILDSSAQSESLQRKADMANGVVQCRGFGESFLNSWNEFRMYVGWGVKSFTLPLNGTFYKFNISDKENLFDKSTIDSDVKVINLNKEYVKLIDENPIAFKQLILHEIGHSRYTQEKTDQAIFNDQEYCVLEYPWNEFRMYIVRGCESFTLHLNGTFYKFNVGDKDTSFNAASMNLDVKEVNLNKKDAELIYKQPLDLIRIILHEIGHSRYTQETADGIIPDGRDCRVSQPASPDEYKIYSHDLQKDNYPIANILDEFHSDMYAFSILLHDEIGKVDIGELISKIYLENRPKNWMEAFIGYPPANESKKMFKKLYERYDGKNQFEEKYECLRDEMIKIFDLHKYEICIGFAVYMLYRCKKAGKTQESLGYYQAVLEMGGRMDVEQNIVYYNDAEYNVSLLAGKK